MESLKLTAYVFLGVIILGLIVHVLEVFYFGTMFGVMIAILGLVVELFVFGIHMKNKRTKKFEWDLSHIGVIALVIIIIGIAVNLISSLLFPDVVGIGNGIMTLGFGVAVLGFFVVAVKEKMK